MGLWLCRDGMQRLIAADKQQQTQVQRVTGMHVVELEARHVRIPLRKPVKHASHARTETDNLVVRCVLADGTVGFGEGVPREYVTGETIDSAIDLLQRSDLPTQLDAVPTFADAGALGRAVDARRGPRRRPQVPRQRRPLRRRVGRARRLRPGVRRAADERDASCSPRTCTSRGSGCSTAA